MNSILYSYSYLLFLILGLSGLVVWDYFAHIALFSQTKATAKVILIAVSLFLVWDILGIVLDIFHTNSRFVSGLHFFTPDLPLEELLFLTTLSYFVLLVDRVWTKR